MSGTFTLTAGALALGLNTLTCGVFSSSNTNTRSIDFGSSANITITGNNTTVFFLGGSAFTLTGTPTVNGTYSGSTGTRTFRTSSGTTDATKINYNISAGSDTVLVFFAANSLDFTGFSGLFQPNSGAFYGDVTFSSTMTVTSGTAAIFFAGTGIQKFTTGGVLIDQPITKNGTGTLEFQDALTQGSAHTFAITNGTVKLKSGTTSTVGAFSATNTTPKFLQSTLAGSQATLSQASGTVSTSYLTIKDINATGGATWNSLWSNNNVDAGNNTGWVFGDPPITLATEYTYALRSFTQPRRF
jgi:hypothetical protein